MDSRNLERNSTMPHNIQFGTFSMGGSRVSNSTSVGGGLAAAATGGGAFGALSGN